MTMYVQKHLLVSCDCVWEACCINGEQCSFGVWHKSYRCSITACIWRVASGLRGVVSGSKVSPEQNCKLVSVVIRLSTVCVLVSAVIFPYEFNKFW